MRLTLANLYGILRQPERARDCYLAALALEPLSAEAHLFYGIHLLSAGEAEGAALRALPRAVPRSRTSRSPTTTWGAAARRRGTPTAPGSPTGTPSRRSAGGRTAKRQAFLGYYPDLPEDGAAFARAAEYALAAL